MEDWIEDDWMQWVETTYEALDAKDVDAFVSQLTPGAEVRFGNGAPVAGRVAVRDAFSEFFKAIDYKLPQWSQDYLSAVEKSLGKAYSEPAADVRGYIDYVRSQSA